MEDESIVASVKNVTNNLDNLGILANLQGLEHLIYGNQSKKRGRKSLVELKEAIALASN